MSCGPINKSGHPPDSSGVASAGILESKGDMLYGKSIRVDIQSQLRELRQSHSIPLVKEAACCPQPGFTVFELATGGCLDTISVLLSGFRHLGGTEDVSKALGRAKAKLFEGLTGERCLGDTKAWKEWISCITREIDYLKSGQPCTDYSTGGSMQGSGGKKGGELFVEQLDTIG